MNFFVFYAAIALIWIVVCFIFITVFNLFAELLSFGFLIQHSLGFYTAFILIAYLAVEKEARDDLVRWIRENKPR